MSVDDDAWGLYVHVPWCRLRCPYCAFYVLPDRDPPSAAFVDRVGTLYAARKCAFVGDPLTIYLGGGTPSRLPLPELTRLLRSVVPPRAREVTVEANPEDVDEAFIRAITSGGADRVSLGVQTLSETSSRRLSRLQGTRAAARAARVCAAGLRTWSADLMFALPGQSPADLSADLDALLNLNPPHVSVYGLTIEGGTPFERATARGSWRETDDDVWRTMYEQLVTRLAVAGLHRYEVSNFARPGHESIHNQGYWTDRPYLGIGPSAHSCLPDGERQVDRPDLQAWLTDADPIGEREAPDARTRAADGLVSGLRGVGGLSLDRLQARTGWRPAEEVIRGLAAHGLLAIEGDRIRLDTDGFFVADGVVARLVDSLSSTPITGPWVRHGLATTPPIR